MKPHANATTYQPDWDVMSEPDHGVCPHCGTRQAQWSRGQGTRLWWVCGCGCRWYTVLVWKREETLAARLGRPARPWRLKAVTPPASPPAQPEPSLES